MDSIKFDDKENCLACQKYSLLILSLSLFFIVINLYDLIDLNDILPTIITFYYYREVLNQAASKIQNAWNSYKNRRLFKLLKNSICAAVCQTLYFMRTLW